MYIILLSHKAGLKRKYAYKYKGHIRTELKGHAILTFVGFQKSRQAPSSSQEDNPTSQAHLPAIHHQEVQLCSHLVSYAIITKEWNKTSERENGVLQTIMQALKNLSTH